MSSILSEGQEYGTENAVLHRIWEFLLIPKTKLLPCARPWDILAEVVLHNLRGQAKSSQVGAVLLFQFGIQVTIFCEDSNPSIGDVENLVCSLHFLMRNCRSVFALYDWEKEVVILIYFAVRCWTRSMFNVWFQFFLWALENREMWL